MSERLTRSTSIQAALRASQIRCRLTVQQPPVRRGRYPGLHRRDLGVHGCSIPDK